MNTLLQIHAQVRIVRGYLRSAFYDLQRESYYYVRNPIAIWLSDNLPCERNVLERVIGSHYEDPLYFMDWLITNELLFEVPSEMLSNFPEISLDLNIPGYLHSATVHAKKLDPLLATELCAIGVRHLVLDCCGLNAEEVRTAVERIPTTIPLLSVTILVDYARLGTEFTGLDLTKDRDLITEVIAQKTTLVTRSVQTLSEEGSILSNCVRPTMRCNLVHYIQARLFNVAFHMHLHVAENGDLFEGHGASQPLGKLDDRNTKDSLLATQYNRSLDTSTKDKTHVCRDCEHRYMCSDHRAPIRLDSDNWYHTTECSYNPYICKWKGEEGYRTLAECGVVSNAEGFIIDHERIATINAELWGE